MPARPQLPGPAGKLRRRTSSRARATHQAKTRQTKSRRLRLVGGALGSTSACAASQPVRVAAGRAGTDIIPLSGSVAARARYVTSTEPRPPGAHPVSPSAIVREARAGRAVRCRRSACRWWRGCGRSPGCLNSRRPPAPTARAARSAASPVSVAASTTPGLGQRSQQRLVGGAVAASIVAASIVGVSPVRRPIAVSRQCPRRRVRPKARGQRLVRRRGWQRRGRVRRAERG